MWNSHPLLHISVRVCRIFVEHNVFVSNLAEAVSFAKFMCNLYDFASFLHFFFLNFLPGYFKFYFLVSIEKINPLASSGHFLLRIGFLIQWCQWHHATLKNVKLAKDVWQTKIQSRYEIYCFFIFFAEKIFLLRKKGKNFPSFFKGFVFHFFNYWNIIRFDIFLPCKNLRLKRYTLNILFRNLQHMVVTYNL